MSGKIPQAFIDNLIARTDIVDLIDARVPLKKTGSNFVACCPFHSEKTPSFSVNREKQFYYCFGCGASGNAIGFLINYDHLQFVEAVEDLASQQGMEVPRESGSDYDAKQVDLLHSVYALNAKVAAFYAKQLSSQHRCQRAIEYLQRRGMAGQTAKTFSIGYAPAGWRELCQRFDKELLMNAGLAKKNENADCYDRFRDRIIFPIRDRRGRVVGFGGRALDDSTPKYLNSPETPVFRKGEEVYGLYEMLEQVSKPQRILLVEGYMDVIMLAQHGFAYAVATLGTATSKNHLAQLFRFCPELVFCFDGDNAGSKAAWRAVETALPLLRDGRSVRVLFLPDGQDPDSLVRCEGATAFERRIVNAQPLSVYFFNQLLKDRQADTIESRAALVEEAKPLITKLPPGVFRELMQSRLAELAHIDSVEINETSALRDRQGNTGSGRKIPSAVRTAIALLSQNPHLVNSVDKAAKNWSKLDSPGIPLLTKLIGICRDRPDLTQGGLLERFRDLPEGKHIERLQREDILIPETGVEVEFVDALKRLNCKVRDDRLGHLLARAKSLNSEEKEELRELSNSKNVDKSFV